MASRLNQAKAEVKAAQGRIAKAWSALIGARVTSAAAFMFALAFGVTLAISPDRLPPIGGLSLAQAGLPPFDLGIERQIISDITGAAGRQGAPETLRGLLAENPWAIPWLNWLGLTIALVTLIVAMRIQIRQHRRGVEPL